MPTTSLRIGADRELVATVGDITELAADAIVNAANSSLAGGGGVDGAIHRAGGPEIMADLEARYGRLRHCPTGGAVVSIAGRLPARWVIHAVGPIWRGGDAGEAALLESAFRTAFGLADEAGARSVSVPAISAGVYGYPLDEAASIGVRTVADALRDAEAVRLATFVLFSERTFAAFAAAVARLAGRA
jgi:O-acetyl-ADP-ribose deacetylase (regulator of RNase III)